VLYFSVKLAEKNPENTLWSNLEGTGIILLSMYFIWHEFLQFNDVDEDEKNTLFARLMKYFGSSLTNAVESCSATLNIFLVLNETFGRQFVDESSLRTFALLAIVFVWYRNFYWMRLFEAPAFFMNLVMRTLYGIIPFTIFLVMLLMALSNVLYIVDKVEHREELVGEDGEIAEI
jgi:hypothetical protein